ncbi:MAG: glycosyltransferase family 4 protein, partial [Anaerolineales bacterium]|nr:glycosyltransferase family 4 protein [Anaerolineales bacterium]
MRIGIDVRYLSHGLFGGVHTYVQHFVPALVEAAAEHQVFLYGDTKRPFELTHLPRPVTLRLLPYRGPHSSLWLDLTLQRAMARDGVEVAHFPANYGFGPAGARTVITVHDAINLLPLAEILRGLRTSNSFNPRNVVMFTYLHALTRAAVDRAHLLLTVSQHARAEIAKHGRLDAERIVAVPHAPTPDLRRLEDPARLAEVRQRHQIARPFILADALKNPGVIVRAWRRLPAEFQERYQMVFFCRRPDPLPVVREAEAAGQARLLVRPSREDLIALYSQAEAFVFPSWIEGFGIPVLEAMTCGAPVIVSNRGALPEVAGDAALLIDADDDAALAGKLAQVLGDPAEAGRLRTKGL